MEVLIGTPVCRKSSYVLDEFLLNQKQIQETYADCELALATDDPDFASELRQMLTNWRLRGSVLEYKVVRPEYARDRIWSILRQRDDTQAPANRDGG